MKNALSKLLIKVILPDSDCTAMLSLYFSLRYNDNWKPWLMGGARANGYLNVQSDINYSIRQWDKLMTG